MPATGTGAPGRRRTGNQQERTSPAHARPTGRDRRAAARQAAEERRAGGDDSRGIPTSALVVGVVALVAILLGVALATGFLTPPGSGSPSASSPDARVTTIVHGQAADVTVVDGSGWVVDDQAGTIRRFDPSSGAFTGKATVVAQRPVSVTAGFGDLWVADAVGNTVVEVNPSTGKVVGSPITVAAEPVSVVAGEGGVWVASLAGNSVSLIDPKLRQVVASVALPDGAVRLALGEGAVWATGTTDTLAKIDPKPLGVSLTWSAVRVGQGPIGVAVGDGSVWVANAVSGTVSRVDPKKLRVTGTEPLGTGGVVGGTTTSAAGGVGSASDPTVVAFFDNRVWVGNGQGATLTAFDPATGRQLGKPASLPGIPRRLIVAGGQLFVTTANPGAVVAVAPN